MLGTLFSTRFSATPRTNGRFTPDDFSAVFPEVTDPGDLLQILETLQANHIATFPPIFSIPALLHGRHGLRVPRLHQCRATQRHLACQPSAICVRRSAREAGPRHGTVNAIHLPAHPSGNEKEHAGLSGEGELDGLGINGLAASTILFQDPMDAELAQWRRCSKMPSGTMEALVRLIGEAVEVQIRGPAEMAACEKDACKR